MYTFLIVMILIASLLMVLAVLVQNPKSGMASNFGASNQVMGVRQTADFLEKFTWGAAVVVLALSLLSTIFIGGKLNDAGKSGAASDLEMLSAPATEQAAEMPQAELPAATEAPAQN
jgi:preprotein translocase subunit SecG